jgi:hypothetical protein
MVFAIKLGRFKVQSIYSYFTNTQALQQKSENGEKQGLVGLTPELEKRAPTFLPRHILLISKNNLRIQSLSFRVQSYKTFRRFIVN